MILLYKLRGRIGLISVREARDLVQHQMIPFAGFLDDLQKSTVLELLNRNLDHPLLLLMLPNFPYVPC